MTRIVSCCDHCFHLQVCLNVQENENSIDKWVAVYDLPQQEKIREDCKTLVGMCVCLCAFGRSSVKLQL
jgi:hypothetical protein